MAPDNKSQTQQVAKGFESALNRHGYSFQSTLLKEVQRLAQAGLSGWSVEVPEFPVEVQGSGTRIDFILKLYNRHLYLLAECKRANPSIASWCFAKSAFIPSVELAYGVFIETVKLNESLQINGKLYAEADVHCLAPSDYIYHVALEAKTDDKGDAGGYGRGAIEEAATQLCRGLNGFIIFVQNRPEIFAPGSVTGFVPVIFTTAHLWVTKLDLSSADLESGNINLTENDVEERKWLFYHYHQSPGLKHSLPLAKQGNALRHILYNEYVRTIAVVNVSGLEEFLGLGIWAA